MPIQWRRMSGSSARSDLPFTALNCTPTPYSRSSSRRASPKRTGSRHGRVRRTSAIIRRSPSAGRHDATSPTSRPVDHRRTASISRPLARNSRARSRFNDDQADAILDDDTALDSWMLRHLGTALHFCGTAKFGATDDPSAVVDQYGRVKGVEGLRIADTSILPPAPTRGPAATAVLVTELIAGITRRGD